MEVPNFMAIGSLVEVSNFYPPYVSVWPRPGSPLPTLHAPTLDKFFGFVEQPLRCSPEKEVNELGPPFRS